MTEKKKPSVWGKMRVHTEEGLDRICKDLERRERAGEKLFTAEDHRRMREEVFGRPKRREEK